MRRLLINLTASVVFGAWPAATSRASETHRAATFEEVTTRVNAWLMQSGASPALREKAAKVWSKETSDATGPKLLHRLGETFAAVDPSARRLVELTAKAHDRRSLPDLSWLAGDELDPFFRDNLRLLAGRWFCQEMLYDEAAAVLKGVRPEQVVDPASLFFYQSVAFHRLLAKAQGLESIRAFLEIADPPQRYAQLAALMQRDLQLLKDGTLDDISRRMEDVERRLGLYRAGKSVRTRQDEIVALLDRIIDELQRDPSQGGESSGPPERSPRPGEGRPPRAADRRIADKPKGTDRGGWNDMPPKKREEVLQQLGRDFPAHYRSAIEQYFRRLAEEEAASGGRKPPGVR
jgi:hypothetical protein